MKKAREAAAMTAVAVQPQTAKLASDASLTSDRPRQTLATQIHGIRVEHGRRIPEHATEYETTA